MKMVKKSRKPLSFFLHIFLFALLISFIAGKFLFLRIDIIGRSMEPTIQDGQTGIALKSLFHHPKTGDVVIIKGEETRDRFWVKRVIAGPGETIEIKNNIVYVNGEKLEENYLETSFEMEDMDCIQMEEDEYFLMGDNRKVSMDSRMVGPIPAEDIIAGHIFIFDFL